MAIKNENITKNIFYQKLSEKTQMIRNNGNKSVCFTNRLFHTKDVADICKLIVNTKKINSIVDIDRLISSALLHDIGHTPFGHAGEETINDLFLSVDESHYSEGFPGLFRHNINSIRLLSKSYFFEEEDYVLVDSILKHSPTIPKNYNYRVFTDSNILKMNYLFRQIGLNNSEFLKNFYCFFQKIKCSKRLSLVFERTTCFACDKCGICYYSKSENANDGISCYLRYPFPLTVEGTVLYWADEISCFVGDLRDLFKFLIYFEKDIDMLIAFSKLESAIRLLECKYSNNRLLSYIKEYTSLLRNKKLADNDRINKCSEILIRIKTHLVYSLRISSIKKVKKDQLCLKINKDGCSILFGLNKNNEEIMGKIKNAIYSDVHNIEYIRKTNEVGQNILRYLIKVYLNNFSYFLNDSEKVGKIHNKDLLDSLSKSLYSLLSIQTKFNNSLLKFSKKIIKVMKSNSFKISNDSLKRFDNISMFINDEKKDYNRIANLFKREIGYFVASLNESDIISILKNKSSYDDEAKDLLSRLIAISLNCA